MAHPTWRRHSCLPRPHSWGCSWFDTVSHPQPVSRKSRHGRQKCPMPHSFRANGNSAEFVGQVGNLRRVVNPPEAVVNRPAGAGCQPARRIPSCPTINAGYSPSRKLSDIGHECLRQLPSTIPSRRCVASVRLAPAATRQPAFAPLLSQCRNVPAGGPQTAPCFQP